LTEFKQLSSDHIDQVMGLEKELFGKEAWSKKTMLSEFVAPHSFYFGVFQGDLVGYAGLRLLPADLSGDITTIGVAKQHQGRGIGRALVQELVRRAKRSGAEQLFLEVKKSNEAAIFLYESFGFEKIDVRKNYYQPSGEDAIVMRLTIHQPVVLGDC